MEPRRSPRATWAAVGAVVSSVLGLLAMAVIGAAPGSPYQPVLTPNGRPKGPLKDLAVELGLLTAKEYELLVAVPSPSQTDFDPRGDL